jgi:hypothetical protein
MILLDLAVAVLATVASIVSLSWLKTKRQAVPASTRNAAVDTMLALGFVMILLVPLGLLTSAVAPAFDDGLVAFLAGSILYAVSIAGTLYGIGRYSTGSSSATQLNT